MIIKVRGNCFGRFFTGGVLNRRKKVNIHITRHNHNTGGVLPRSTFDAHATLCKFGDKGAVLFQVHFRKIFFDVTEGGFFGNRADTSCAINIVPPK